jgi:polyisoprenyl-teichoic acid--peptidoglycan teichoic acid transferase
MNLMARRATRLCGRRTIPVARAHVLWRCVDGILSDVVATILRRKLFWTCTVLVLIGIGASLYANQAAYNFCASGELAANVFISWICNYSANTTITTEIYATPAPAAVQPGITPTKAPAASLPRPWNGKERVNVLVMGIDQREVDKEPAYRTDTMIVLTLDPVTLHAGMLSIPRDLWVPIPGYDNGRINTANFIGDAYDYPGGGPALARKTVESLLGVPINYYARVNFTAFEAFIDRVGGISVDVPEDIYDPEYPTNDYRTEVFSIDKGVHNLDGATALKFARTRHSLLNGDFDRARNQQLVLLALKEKVSNPQVLLSLLSSAPEVITELGGAVKTDLTLDQVQQLAALVQKVDRNKIKTAVLDQEYTEFATTLTNPPQQVQVPIRGKIAELRDTMFSTAVNAAIETRSSGTDPGAVAAVSATAAAPAQWQSENARIVLLNGTLTAGFGQKVSDQLTALGFTVVRVGNPPDDRFDYEQTIVTDYGGKRLTLDALVEALDVKSSAEVKRLLDPNAEADIVVVLGNDIKLP